VFAIVISILVFHSTLVVQRAAVRSLPLPRAAAFCRPPASSFGLVPVDQSVMVAWQLSWEAARHVRV